MNKFLTLPFVLLIAGFAQAQPAAPIVQAVSTDAIVVEAEVASTPVIEVSVDEVVASETVQEAPASEETAL